MSRRLAILANAAAALSVLLAQVLAVWLTNPGLSIRTDLPPRVPPGHRLSNDDVGDLPTFVYSALLLGQAASHPSAFREDPRHKSWLMLLPELRLDRDASASFVLKWVGIHQVVSILLLGAFSAVAHQILRGRRPTENAIQLASLAPFWWVLLGTAAWLYVHVALTFEVSAKVASVLEPALVVGLATNLFLLLNPVRRLILRVPTRWRLPLPVALLDMAFLQYVVLTHGYPYEGWYDTWPPEMWGSFVVVWAPFQRFFASLYPVLAQPSAALLRYLRLHPGKAPTLVLDLVKRLPTAQVFLYCSLANTLVWVAIIGLIWRVATSGRRHAPRSAGA